MKTIIILLLASCMSLSLGVSAQESESGDREKIKFGMKLGFNRSNIYSSRTQDFQAKGKFGFAGGAWVSIPINKFFGVQPELLISQKGFKGEGMLLGGAYNFTRTTTYLDIPLLVTIKPFDFVTVLAGPSYSYLLKQRDVFTNTFLSYAQEEEFKNDNIRKNILGFVGGLDINVDHYVFGIRAGWDIVRNHGNGSSNTPRYKNTWVQLTLGYRF
jgi:hypothetical protein